MCIDLTEGRHLVGRKNYLTEAALPCVCDVLEIDKEAVLAEHLLTENSKNRKRSSLKAVG